MQEDVAIGIWINDCGGGDLDVGTPLTNSEGYYAVGDLANGVNYLVQPLEDGYSSAPIRFWVDIEQDPIQSHDFTLTTED